MKTIVWFRQDLRTFDNPALAAAAAKGAAVPLFILDEEADSERRLGGASRWWLHHSLAALQNQLGQLVLLKGTATALLPSFAEKIGASAVYWNRCYEPHAILRDRGLKASLTKQGIEAQSFNGSLLHEPWEVATATGYPFKVFTPFWRASVSKSVAKPLSRPTVKIAPSEVRGDRLDDWRLLPDRPNWDAGWERLWRPGELGALASLKAFVQERLTDYANLRDRPDRDGTSRLSPHLHWGEISPRQVWARIAVEEHDASKRKAIDKFRSELGWREFSYHLLYHFPTLPQQNWRSEFDAYPWRTSDDDLKSWQRGQTGYPLVDAGMRELWKTGWMHNRVRMIAASFLVKHLQIDWRQGEAWFWDTLVDADLANNAAGWQWVAGSGADASPYFRIFNPVSQGRKFDPEGEYVRRWCPELAKLPNDFIHAPFDAPAGVLAQAGVMLGRTYPSPIIDHTLARNAALAGYQQVRSARS
jgi:deoxyribodipyrimidine photo-lyase